MKKYVGWLLLSLVILNAHAQEDEVRAAMQAQLDAPKLRTILTYVENDEANSIIDYVAPNSFRIANAVTEMIIVGDKTYEKDAGGSWAILELDMGAVIVQNRNTLDEVVFSDVQALGGETINGKACKVYSYTSDFMGLIQQNKLWVEESSGLPLRLQSSSEVEVGGQKIDGVSEYDYSDSLEITAPM